MNESAVIF